MTLVVVIYLLCTFALVCGNPFMPFCAENNCENPTQLYPQGDDRNFPEVENYISRSNPDGIHEWPIACTNITCEVKIYEVLPRATWWDNFADVQALPTNTWFVPYYSKSPYDANPDGWAWYAYALPFSTSATDNGFLVSWPIPQQPTDTIPGAWQDGQTPPQIVFDTCTEMFNFSAAGGVTYEKQITNYDENGLGIELNYPTVNGGSMQIPIFRGSPFMTFVYTNAIPVLNMTWGIIKSVNGIETLDTNYPYTHIPPIIVNGLFLFSIDIYYNTELALQFRLYTNFKTSISVGKINGSSIVFDEICDECILRLACSINNFQDPIEPSPFYSRQFIVDNTTLDNAANVYPVFTQDPLVTFASDSNSSTVTFQWQTSCMCPTCSFCDPQYLLMMALPHHIELLSSPSSSPSSSLSSPLPTNISYPTMMGLTTGYTGNIWTLQYTTEFILPDLLIGDPFLYKVSITNTTQANIVLQQLQADLQSFSSSQVELDFDGADCYAFGKLVAALARLVIIAESLGDQNSVLTGKALLKARLNQWLDQDESVQFSYRFNEQFVYDLTWGGIAPIDGIKSLGPDWMGPNATMAEFGSGGYNDHLFHYGYYLYATATILYKADSDDLNWWGRVSDRVLALARDIANPNSDADPFFPQFRHKSDWFTGHSWASGLFTSGAYPNIESTAEALNAWYSLYLLGYAVAETGDIVGSNLMTAGKFLMETDLQSFRYYSHLWVNSSLSPTPQNNQLYPPSFTSLGIVGNLWGGNAVFQTFFSYGMCQWINNTDFTYCDKARSALTSDQIRYFNVLFILGINSLPFTPFTQFLLDREWLAQIIDTQALYFEFPNGASYGFDPRIISEALPDPYGKCQYSNPSDCDGWIVYAWQILSRLGGNFIEISWNEISQTKVVAQGSTLTNALHFVASQPL